MMVTVAGLDDQPVTGKKGHGPVAVDTTVDRVAAADFDALVIPGGYAPDKLRRSEAVLAVLQAFDAADKPIAFICLRAGSRATVESRSNDLEHDHQG